eukprot:Gb_21179 [translate_table: standard]
MTPVTVSVISWPMLLILGQSVVTSSLRDDGILKRQRNQLNDYLPKSPANITNQECSLAFRASNMETLLHGPAPNDSILDHSGPLVIDTRESDLRPEIPTIGTMAFSTNAVDSNILYLETCKNLEEETQKIKGKLTRPQFQDRESFYQKVDDPCCVNFGELRSTGHYGHWPMFSNTQIVIEKPLCLLVRETKVTSDIPKQHQARLMLQNAGILDKRGNIDADMNGHGNINNKTMIRAVVIKSWRLVNFSPRLSPTKLINTYTFIARISGFAEMLQSIFLSKTQTVLKDIVYQDLEAQAKQKRGGGTLLAIANSATAKAMEHKDNLPLKLCQEIVCYTGAIKISFCQHMSKEEEQAFPLVTQHFSFKKQASLVWHFMCSIPVNLMEEFLPLLASSLSTDDQKDMIKCGFEESFVPSNEPSKESWCVKGVTAPCTSNQEICIFHNATEDKVVFPAVGQKNARGCLRTSEIYSKLCTQADLIMEIVQQHFLDEEFGVLHLGREHCSIEEQLNLPYQKLALPWLVAILSEDEAKEMLWNMQLTAPAADMALDTLFNGWACKGHTKYILVSTDMDGRPLKGPHSSKIDKECNAYYQSASVNVIGQSGIPYLSQPCCIPGWGMSGSDLVVSCDSIQGVNLVTIAYAGHSPILYSHVIFWAKPFTIDLTNVVVGEGTLPCGRLTFKHAAVLNPTHREISSSGNFENWRHYQKQQYIRKQIPDSTQTQFFEKINVNQICMLW